jgi:hypothetical protein
MLEQNHVERSPLAPHLNTIDVVPKTDEPQQGVLQRNWISQKYILRRLRLRGPPIYRRLICGKPGLDAALMRDVGVIRSILVGV